MLARPARLGTLLALFVAAPALWAPRAGAGGGHSGRKHEQARGGIECKSVAHIGDSLSAYTKETLASAYELVGAEAEIDAFGGRATLQKLKSDPKTGKQAAKAIRAAGFDGCWVIALGTNDTANVAAGAGYTRAKAIDEMMTVIDPEAKAPVLWINTYTTLTGGYYSNQNMKLWNRALDAARTRWQNLVVFDWASVAATGVAPFSDGIHHTNRGYEARNRAIAEALLSFSRGRG